MNRTGLLGYAGAANDNVILALPIETDSCIKNIDEIAAVVGVDLLFLGQKRAVDVDGTVRKIQIFRHVHAPELGAATDKLRRAAKRNNVTLGLFLFGTARVGEFLEKGFPFISIGNDPHHFPTQAGAYVKDMETVSQKKTAVPGHGGRRLSSSSLRATG
jgi:4-hydroxy-2-oxoheptanedioate aldolase